jgi:PAS domain S-box-containing protein
MKGGRQHQSLWVRQGGRYSYLDDQVLPLVQQKEVIALNNLGRVRMLTFPANTPRPEAILALPLQHENMFYGALWLAYDTPHQFGNDEVRFLTTIAGQAALAAANSQLFANAEIGRQRLAATLNSTPDPVLVTDYQGRLLLANPAAWQVLGLPGESVNGKSIDSIIQQPALLGLLQVVSEEKQSAEVELADGKIYLATASSVIVEGQPVGRVCILRDVTRFKELDTLKSEFVATVSHDLRYPLTTMRGYATMLEMVGELNEQQTGYVRKILTSVDGMNQLVTSLLDLGRIDAGVDLQLEMVPVQEVVDRVVGALQLQASQKQVVISSDISSTPSLSSKPIMPYYSKPCTTWLRMPSSTQNRAVKSQCGLSPIEIRWYSPLLTPGSVSLQWTFPAYSRSSTVVVRKKLRNAKVRGWV